LNQSVEFYALASSRSHLAELFLEREDAEQALRNILADHPGWAGELSLLLIDFSGREPAIHYLRREVQYPDPGLWL
jgi:hypothetical protein